MKKCDVCGAMYSEQQGICPVCGYEPTGLYVGGAEDWKHEVESYRSHLLSTLSTELICYAHKAAGETLTAEERCIPLTERGALQADSTEQWLREPFCAVPDGGILSVSLRVLRDGTLCAKKTVSVTAPTEHALLHLGIALEPDTLNARLLLKNSSRSISSEPFALLGE